MTNMPAKARASPIACSLRRPRALRRRLAGQTAGPNRRPVPAALSAGALQCEARATETVNTRRSTMRKQLAAFFLSLALASAAAAQDWGDLDGTFLFKGTPPTPNKIRPEKDPEFCGKHDIFEETLTVNKDNKGIAN